MNAATKDVVVGGTQFLVSCHRRPDADALGSALGFAAVLRALGKKAFVYVPDEIPPMLRFMVLPGEVHQSIPTDARFDATFVMDTAAKNLLPDGLPASDVAGPRVIIDHHFSHDDVGDIVLRDPNASSTGEMVLRLTEELGVSPIPAAAATPLYAAIVADTGGFRYSSTKPATFRLAADLLEAGADPWAVAYELFEGWEPAKIKLLSTVLDTLRLYHDGRLAVLTLTRKTLAACHADDYMAEGLVNYARHLRGVEVGALLWEWPSTDGDSLPTTKLSLRSRGEFDVSTIAGVFGGGGHRGAAAAHVSASIDDTNQRLVDEVAKRLP